jgi:competence protein ComFC
MKAQFKNIFEIALNFLYPPVCQICSKERATAGEGYVCQDCASGLDGVHFVEPPFCNRCGLPFDGDITTEFQCWNCRTMNLYFSKARSAVRNSKVVVDIIHRYKYNRALWFEPFLSGLLVQAAIPVLQQEQWDFIVPVPLYSVKEREREFNQSERLARPLSEVARIPMNTKLLRRVEATRSQTLLTRDQRAANVGTAFAMKPGATLNGEKIVLLDDLFTTGATTNACAKVLRKAGAGEVCVWTVIRNL